MKLRSVNVSLPKDVPYRDSTLRTGIYKQPVTGRVRLNTLNLDGDGQADLNAHGGRDMAVYVYPFEHYAFWSQTLGRDDFTYGQFGENFTVEGLLEDAVYIGDIYRIGGTQVQVTQGRIPCFKLAHKMQEPTFVKQFTHAERTGFYVRVLEAGEVGAGDTIERVATGEGRMSVQEVFHLRIADKANREAAARAAQLPALSATWRTYFEKAADKT